MYAVTGSTGQLGELVIASLIKKVEPSQIVALARDTKKGEHFKAKGVQVRKADYNSAADWDKALVGVTKLLLISSSEIGKRATQHKAVIAAAKKAGVKQIIYTSILHADTSPLGLAKEHLETEIDLKKSGLPYVLLRNGWYSENYTVGAKGAVAHGAVFGSAGEGRISSAPRVDYAEAAAIVLTQDKQDGRVYELAGDSSYSLSEYAQAISKQVGKTIGYTNLPQADYEALLIKVGLPTPVADLLADSDVGASKGGLYDETHQLSKLLGRQTGSLDEAIKKVLNN